VRFDLQTSSAKALFRKTAGGLGRPAGFEVGRVIGRGEGGAPNSLGKDRGPCSALIISRAVFRLKGEWSAWGFFESCMMPAHDIVRAHCEL
jgi:hypothetical protein